MAEKPQTLKQEQEAIRLKTLALSKFNSSKLKSALNYANQALNLSTNLPGLEQLLAIFKIHNSSKNPRKTLKNPDFYDILGVTHFCSLNLIKAQYKKLAFLLQSDKNTLKNAADEAFEIVNDAFRVLSDKGKRKEYDARLRLALLEERDEREDEEGVVGSSRCTKCRLMYRFEKQCDGQRLVCPSCEDGDDDVGVRKRGRIGDRKAVVEDGVEDWEMSSLSELVRKRRMKKVNLSEVLEREENARVETAIVEERRRSCREKSKKDCRKLGLRSGVVEEDVDKSKNDDELEELTLAEIQLKSLRKSKGKKDGGKRKVTISEEVEEEEQVVMNKKRRVFAVESGDLEVMTVEDSDFYDFDKDRVERSFKQGQVWAIYDDDDGMPRHFGLIDEVVSVKPFAVKMSWLDFQNDGDERLTCWEKSGFHVSCGKFKVARKDDVKLLNIYSHLVECERVARELYLIYPRKGSIWALYNGSTLDGGGSNSPRANQRGYDIVLFLTSYSEVYGLSMVYLEKVDGYKTVFTRPEIGYNAVRWLEKIDMRLFSHQIPARKLSGDEAPKLSGDCWELDPASLPQDLLAVTSTLQGQLVAMTPMRM